MWAMAAYLLAEKRAERSVPTASDNQAGRRPGRRLIGVLPAIRRASSQASRSTSAKRILCRVRRPTGMLCLGGRVEDMSLWDDRIYTFFPA